MEFQDKISELRRLRRPPSSGRPASNSSSPTKTSKTSRSAARAVKRSAQRARRAAAASAASASRRAPTARPAARKPPCRSVRRRDARCSVVSASSRGNSQGPAASNIPSTSRRDRQATPRRGLRCFRDLSRRRESLSHEHPAITPMRHPSDSNHQFSWSSSRSRPRAIAAARPGAGGPAPAARRPAPGSRRRHRHAQGRRRSNSSSDFISTVRSLNSTTIQPQVDGRVTQIYVKSGDIVRAGTPLVQIDPEKQAATLRNTESQRAGREADVTYWKAQVERLQSLLKAGAISQNEFDAAQHNLDYRRRRTSPRSTRRSAKDACSSSTTASPRRRPAWSATSRSAKAIASRRRRSSRRSTTRRGSRPTSRCRSIARPTCASAWRRRSSTPTARSWRTNPITLRLAARRSRDADGAGEERC